MINTNNYHAYFEDSAKENNILHTENRYIGGTVNELLV